MCGIHRKRVEFAFQRGIHEKAWNSRKRRGIYRDGVEFTKQREIGRRVLGDVGRHATQPHTGTLVSLYVPPQRALQRGHPQQTSTAMPMLPSRPPWWVCGGDADAQHLPISASSINRKQSKKRRGGRSVSMSLSWSDAIVKWGIYCAWALAVVQCAD